MAGGRSRITWVGEVTLIFFFPIITGWLVGIDGRQGGRQDRDVDVDWKKKILVFLVGWVMMVWGLKQIMREGGNSLHSLCCYLTGTWPNRRDGWCGLNEEFSVVRMSEDGVGVEAFSWGKELIYHFIVVVHHLGDIRWHGYKDNFVWGSRP